MRITYQSQLEQKELRHNLETNLDTISEIFCTYNDDTKVVQVLMDEIFRKTHPDIYLRQNEFPVENKIRNALAFSIKMHKGQYRDSGVPYASHPVQNGYLVSEFGSTIDTVVVSLLHDVLEENEENLMRVAKEVIIRFGRNTFGNILSQSTFERGKDRDKLLTENIWFVYDTATDNNIFRNKCADGISNLYTINYMHPKNGMTAEQRKRKFCSNARTTLLPMSRELDAKGDIMLNVTEYLQELLRRV